MTPDIYSAMLLFQSFHKRDNDGNATNFAETLYICAIQELHSFTSGSGFQPGSDRDPEIISCRPAEVAKRLYALRLYNQEKAYLFYSRN